MPELPEVETVVRGLRAKLPSQTLERVVVYKPLVVKEPAASFSKRLTGKKVVAIERHGKSMFIIFDNALCLKIHLGMTGQLLFVSKTARPDPYVRVLFQLSSPEFDLVYRDVRQFGGLRFVAQAHEPTWGPDAWKAPVAETIIALRKKTGMVKHALLNQLVIAGVGNIYADESLHMSKIHPKQKLEKLSLADVKRLGEAVRAVLKRSLDLGGTSFRNYTDTAGARGGFKGRLRVYGKTGEPCIECGTPIVKTVVASRGTHYCPKCQKEKKAGKRRKLEN
jgi:formamidopyrimidine-DNA glycosylase